MEKDEFIKCAISFAILNDWFIEVSKDFESFTDKVVIYEFPNIKNVLYDDTNKVIRLSDDLGGAIQLIL